MRRAIIGAAFAAALLVSAAGCGGGGQSPDQKAVSDTVHQYLRAFIDHDPNAACRTFTPALLKRIASATSGQSDPLAACATFYKTPVETLANLLQGAGISGDDIDGIDVKVEVKGSTATASVKDIGNQLQLKHVGDRWLISERLGATAAG
jgi:hypothetical protein